MYIEAQINLFLELIKLFYPKYLIAMGKLDSMTKINIAGMLNAATTDNILASAAQVYDNIQGMSQEEINAQIINSGNISINALTYIQEELSNKWVITHNMNKFPSVTIIDSDNCLVFADVHYDSENQITINFSKEIKGKVYLV